VPKGVRGRHPVSCLACLSWGLPYSNGLCRPCWWFAYRYRQGRCGACHRRLPVNKGYCRLCWCQARMNRSESLGGAPGTYKMLLPHVQTVCHHQLLLGGLPQRRRDLVGKPHARRHGIGSGAPGIPHRSAPPAANRPRADWLQPPLFDLPRRHYRPGRVDLRTQPVPDNPWLRWALHLAHAYAEAHGFEPLVYAALNRTLVMLLANHTGDETILFSDIHRVLRPRGNSTDHTAHVLDTMGILIDDRPRPFDGWLDTKLSGIAADISRHVRQWARVLHNGAARVKPRNEQTVRSYVWALRPVLVAWSTDHQHLREINRDDVLAILTTLSGQRRRYTLQVLRSLFRWAKTNGIVFRDPTSRIRPNHVEHPIPQPLTPDQITTTVQAATTPHLRLAIALAAVHGARHGDIINTRLSDIDTGDRRLTIAGRTRPLDDLTYTLLVDWLTYRRQRWPNTANTHLLVSSQSALRLGPISRIGLARHLLRLPATLERLRVDRHLDEAIASNADPLHLTEVFGVSESTAIRYTNAARQLLATTIEQPPPVHDEPPDPR